MRFTREQLANHPKLASLILNEKVSSNPRIQDSKQLKRTKALARSDAGETQGSRLLHCRFTLVRKSLLDVDAKYASVKDLLDCLVFSGVIPGDKEGQITLEVIQRKTNKAEPKQTEIEVEEIPL
jgi:hypothetical protein